MRVSAAFCVCLLATAAAARPGSAAEPSLSQGEELRFVGAASCAAANCHGGDPFRGVRGAEHNVWLARDPHADSGATLDRAESDAIVRRLSQSPLYAHLKDVAARDAADCRACHSDEPLPLFPLGKGWGEGQTEVPNVESGGSSFSSGTAADEPPARLHFTSSEGVSCEACHGAASGWLAAHVQAGWKSRSAEAKAALGFIDTKHLPSRISQCAKCHIGSRGEAAAGQAPRDVNHDLIAAGHPRLLWETAAYHALLPRHWTQPDNQAKLWAVGQAASAAAAAELLANRASAAERGQGVWPEFAEYRCAACHQDLASIGWTRASGPSRVAGRLGTAGWQSWHFDLSMHLDLRSELSERIASRLDLLHSVMEDSTAAPGSIANAVSELHRDYLTLIDVVNAAEFDSIQSRQILQSLWNEMAGLDEDPDLKAGVWLATAALAERACNGNGNLRRELEGLRRKLRGAHRRSESSSAPVPASPRLWLDHHLRILEQ